MNVIQNQSNSVKSHSAKTLNCVLAIGAGSFLTSDQLAPSEKFQDELILEKVTTVFNTLPARSTTYVEKPVLRPLPLSAIVFGGVTATCALLMAETKGNSDTSAAAKVSVDTPKEAQSTSSIVAHKDAVRPQFSTPVTEHSENSPFAEPVEEAEEKENQEEEEKNQEEVVVLEEKEEKNQEEVVVLEEKEEKNQEEVVVLEEKEEKNQEERKTFLPSENELKEEGDQKMNLKKLPENPSAIKTYLPMIAGALAALAFGLCMDFGGTSTHDEGLPPTQPEPVSCETSSDCPAISTQVANGVWWETEGQDNQCIKKRCHPDIDPKELEKCNPARFGYKIPDSYSKTKKYNHAQIPRQVDSSGNLKRGWMDMFFGQIGTPVEKDGSDHPNIVACNMATRFLHEHYDLPAEVVGKYGEDSLNAIERIKRNVLKDLHTDQNKEDGAADKFIKWTNLFNYLVHWNKHFIQHKSFVPERYNGQSEGPLELVYLNDATTTFTEEEYKRLYAGSNVPLTEDEIAMIAQNKIPCRMNHHPIQCDYEDILKEEAIRTYKMTPKKAGPHFVNFGDRGRTSETEDGDRKPNKRRGDIDWTVYHRTKGHTENYPYNVEYEQEKKEEPEDSPAPWGDYWVTTEEDPYAAMDKDEGAGVLAVYDVPMDNAVTKKDMYHDGKPSNNPRDNLNKIPWNHNYWTRDLGQCGMWYKDCTYEDFKKEQEHLEICEKHPENCAGPWEDNPQRIFQV